MPVNEAERLGELERYGILDTEPEETFDTLVRLAGQLADTPYALISFMAQDRQWFKARVGVTLQQIPLSWAPCRHVVEEERTIVCENAQHDPRFADSPWVSDAPGVCFYAGIPLRSPGGWVVGTLAVMDTVPRTISAFQVEALGVLAQQVVDELEFRVAQRTVAWLQLREKEFEQRMQRERVQEARRLAADLHDGLGQELAALSLFLDAFSRTRPAQAQEVQEPLLKMSRLVKQTMISCRRIAEGHGGFRVSKLGVIGALKRVATVFESEGIHIEFSGPGFPIGTLEEATAYHLFRIGHEAIRNACRHSGCTQVRVHSEYRDGCAILIVEDDGVGLVNPDKLDAGIGRSIMEYRAKSIGAALDFVTLDTGGLRVECRLNCLPRESRPIGA